MKSNEDWLNQQIAQVEGTQGYELERLVLQIQEQLGGRMERLDINRSSLAKMMGVGRWAVSRLFNRVANVELKTLVSAACALKSRLTVAIEPIEGDRRDTIPASPTVTQRAVFYGGSAPLGYGNVLPFGATARHSSVDQPFTSEGHDDGGKTATA